MHLIAAECFDGRVIAIADGGGVEYQVSRNEAERQSISAWVQSALRQLQSQDVRVVITITRKVGGTQEP